MKNVSMSSQKNDVWGTVCEELTQNGMVAYGALPCRFSGWNLSLIIC